jgi:cytochrome c-type biogenesis protein CcmF
MGWAPLSQWKLPYSRKWLQYTLRHYLLSLGLSIALTLFFADQWNSAVILNLSLVFWVFLSLNQLFFRQTAMTVAHFGFALVVMSIILSSAFSTERELRLHTGESVTLGPYVFHFKNVEGHQGPNFKAVRGNFSLTRKGRFITELHPEKRIYLVRNMVMTKIDIYPGVFHDVYIALGEPITEDDWSLRIYYKPFIRWIWLGGFCIALGGFVSLLGSARRKKHE